MSSPATDRPAGADVLAPAWLREVETSVVTSSHLLIYGNVRDTYLIPAESGGWAFRAIVDSLWWCLKRIGYPVMLRADVVDGVTGLPDSPDGADLAKHLLGGRIDLAKALSLEGLYAIVDRLTRQPSDAARPGALVIDYAARLVRNLPQLEPAEHVFFAGCEKLSRTARPIDWDDNSSRYNPVIWLVDHERELPSWFLAGNESIRRIAVPMPDLDDRLAAARVLAPGLLGLDAAPADLESEATRFAEQTQGMTLRSMLEIVRLSRSGITAVGTVEDAARCYRIGIFDNPWGKAALRDRLTDAQTRLARRLRGQDEAIERSIDIVVRSVMGLSGAQASSQVAKPRGVLFFAGPTGVGKTELAKALTEMIFGDERAYIRFDMSEFAAEHAAERLVGAPPGYLGHDAGGELTNAMRRQPFSLLLFDEIEKAHPRVLDRFLQILDDGRLTDGSGSTVHFSEAVIVFTSNLGMKVDDGQGGFVDNIAPEMDHAEIDRRMTAAIREHFTSTLNRPELLNRIGDNIVVFNFISPVAAREIFDGQLRRILDRVQRQQGRTITVEEGVRAELQDRATSDLTFGGRGIGSYLERAFVNPLARALFAEGANSPEALTVTKIHEDAGQWSLVLAPASDPTTAT